MNDLYEKCLKNARPVQQKMEENLYNVRVLDIKAQMAENEFRQKLAQMANTLKKTSKEERRRQYEEIEKLFEKSKDLCNEKIQLAEETYGMVDTFIQKLDKETLNFNTLAERNQRTPHSSRAGTSKENVADEQQLTTTASRRRGTAPATSMTTKKGTMGRRSTKEATASTKKAESGGGIGADNDGTQLVISKGDMPIDPNEPRYCFCQQVSFGHMVGCDNKDCSLEWFHFDCVGLKASPKGKWYCPKCREDRDMARRQQQKTPKGSARGKDISSGR